MSLIVSSASFYGVRDYDSRTCFEKRVRERNLTLELH
jgi:hypothetical protein